MEKVVDYEKEESDSDDMPSHVMISKIDNGFLIETCCCSESQKLYFDKLSNAPSLIGRLLGLKGKSRDEIKRMSKVEKEEEKKDGKTYVKLKITS